MGEGEREGGEGRRDKERGGGEGEREGKVRGRGRREGGEGEREGKERGRGRREGVNTCLPFMAKAMLCQTHHIGMPTNHRHTILYTDQLMYILSSQVNYI